MRLSELFRLSLFEEVREWNHRGTSPDRYHQGEVIQRKPERCTVIGTLLVGTLTCAYAQWLNYPDPRIPRTRDGKPDLTAPAPKSADGRPDLSGVWRGRGGRYRFTGDDLANNFKPGDFPVQNWVEWLTEHRRAAPGIDDPEIQCLIEGITRGYANSAFFPLKIIQIPGTVVFLYEHMWTFRQIFTDGRRLPDNPTPTWLGYSVGRWDGDALVIDSSGFNGKTWLDDLGHPSTESLHLTERLRRVDFGHMELILTVDDPKAYTKQWTVTEALDLFPDGELIEYQCLENERDLMHIQGYKRQ